VNKDQDHRRFEITLRMPEGERTLEVAADEHVWDAAFRHGIELPALCHQGWCLTCAGRIEGGGELNQADSLTYLPEDRDAGFVLLCTGRPCSDVAIHTHQATEMRKHRLRHRLPAPYSQGVKP
jgi:ferredoxin